MTFREIENGFLVRLERGELIAEQLLNFAREQNIQAAWLSGLGGAEWAELGFYQLDEKRYEFKKFDELLEITNLTGNIALADGKPALHIHATVSNQQLKAFAGHLKEASIGGTFEIYIVTFDQPLERALDSNIGLPLLQL